VEKRSDILSAIPDSVILESIPEGRDMAVAVERLTRRRFLYSTVGMTAWLVMSGWFVQEPAALSREEKEQFLLKAKIIGTRSISVGITGSVRATLSDGRTTHDAHIQSIDFYSPRYRHKDGVELHFKDSYKFNIAAYRLALLLGLENVPPSVERSYQRRKAAFTWWVDDVMMDEKARQAKKIEPPQTQDWNRQMCVVTVFDELICNIDRNQGNLLIASDWGMWMIDHTRAFRPFTNLRKPESLTHCDRDLFARLKDLNIEVVREQLSKYLSKPEMDALMARRDLIVRRFEALGEGALFDGTRPVNQVPAP
jgi:hypothetical protein